MLKPDSRAGNEDETVVLVGELWKDLGGEGKQGVNSGLLQQHVAAILNVPLSSQAAQPLSPGADSHPPLQSALNGETIQRLQKKYAALSFTRKSQKPQRAGAKASNREFDFKPALCEKSVKLAESARDRHLKSEEAAKRKSAVGLADALTQHKREQEEYLPSRATS